jgi:solute carrier family 25 S-adenosylmethionine transporter 26
MFAFPLGAVQFTVFGNMKKALTSMVGNASGGVKGTAVAIASSMCASLASCAVGVPQEILKQRLVTNIYPNFATAVSTIWKTEGLKGFYVGWGPTVARNLPYVVITFTTFNHWKTQELKKTESTSLDTATALKFGMGASLIGCLATQPLDVVKTRMMTQAASNLEPYSSALNCVKDIIKTEGITSFLAGLPPRVAYISPLWGAQFLLNEKITRALGEWNYQANLRPGIKRSGNIVRGPSPGPGRAAWVRHNNMVWTVGIPKGRDKNAGIAEQTKLTLASIDERLAQAGTHKSKIIEATGT